MRDPPTASRLSHRHRRLSRGHRSRDGSSECRRLRCEGTPPALAQASGVWDPSPTPCCFPTASVRLVSMYAHRWMIRRRGRAASLGHSNRCTLTCSASFLFLFFYVPTTLATSAWSASRIDERGRMEQRGCVPRGVHECPPSECISAACQERQEAPHGGCEFPGSSRNVRKHIKQLKTTCKHAPSGTRAQTRILSIVDETKMYRLATIEIRGNLISYRSEFLFFF